MRISQKYPYSLKYPHRFEAFAVIELMLVVVILGLLSATAYNVYGKISKVADTEKLKTEVKTLNSAVAIYQGFGGKFNDESDPAEVIGKLKSIVHSDSAARIPGLSSSMVDARLSVEMQTADQAKTGELRAVWNPETNQFVVATEGIGVSRFGLDADPEKIPEPDQRELVALYAKNSTWVWEFEETGMPVIEGPTSVATTSSTEISNGEVPTDEIPEPVVPSSKESLNPPGINPQPGGYSIRDFSMPVRFTNPNRPGISKLYYSVDYGPWSEYNGSPVTVPPDANIAAQVVPKYRKDYQSSAMNRGDYQAEPVILSPPTITPTVTSFGAFSERYSVVSLEDSNTGDPAYVEYRIARGPWRVYDEPFTVDSELYGEDVLLEARSTSDNIYYQVSEVAPLVLDYIPFSVEGEAEARFHTAYGYSGSRARQTAYNNFYWGRTYDSRGRHINGLSESMMEFIGEENEDTEFGIRFDLGSLDYYNGAILEHTGATSVMLDLALDLNISGHDASTNFSFRFNLEDTTNYGNYRGNGYDAWRSADYVQITESSQTNTFSLQGVLLDFTLEFGDASEYGFAEFDEFHVLEERSANTRVFGTLRLTEVE